MSAIFGIISKHRGSIKDSWVTSMRDNLKHRGPDGTNIWHDDSVVLGHMMMHTTQESCFDTQPLEYQHWVITADVRLDNRKELFKILDIAPSSQSTTTDSLLIAKAFEKWGKRCPEFLVGDFAFAIWDKLDRSVYCAKDHTGVRQLFYYDSPKFFVFSSEIRSISDLEFVSRALDLNRFSNFIISYFPAGEAASNTFIKEVKRLMPAHWLFWENQQLITTLYWKRDPDYKIKFNDEREYGLALRALIEQAVSDRMRTDFPVGVTLSGGLDSSSVACVAARMLAQKGKKLFSTSSVLPLNYGGFETDERKYIQLVLEQEKNIIPKFVSAPGIGAFDSLEDIFKKTYEPVNPFYYMDFALSRSLAPNTRIVLSGYLGDGTVSNQGRFVLATLAKQLRLFTALRVLQARKKISKQSYLRLMLSQLIAPFIPYDLRNFLKKTLINGIHRNFSILDSAASQSFISAKRVKLLHEKQERTLSSNIDPYGYIWDTSNLLFLGEEDLSSYQQQENAHPFTDKRIIEFLWASPPEYFHYQGYSRGYIRRAMEGILPNEILWRKDKVAYSPDFQKRMRDETTELVKLFDEMNGEFSQYLDFTNIKTQLLNSKDWKKFDLKSITVIHNGIQALKYLQWIQAKMGIVP